MGRSSGPIDPVNMKPNVMGCVAQAQAQSSGVTWPVGRGV